MSGFDPRNIRPPAPAERGPSLVDRVRDAIAPPGTKITEQQARTLDGLVSRSDARALIRGRGPHQHFRVQRTLEEHVQRVRRRIRRRQKRAAQRNAT